MTVKTILVTGISGFIAKHCAIELLRHGYLVRGTLRSLKKADEVRATLAKHCDCTGLEFAEADLLADSGWDSAMQGIDGVLHLASPFPLAKPKDPDELLRPAVDGTLRGLKTAVAAKVPRLVQTSSMAAVAHSPCRPVRRRGRPGGQGVQGNQGTTVHGVSPSVMPSSSQAPCRCGSSGFARESGADPGVNCPDSDPSLNRESSLQALD